MSSNLCSCSVTSNTFAGTLTGGIQDIAALLPLLGTEQCENHVSSALTKGYLYAAASPISLFGTLGVARAGLKTLLAGLDIPCCNLVGARILSNMGFQTAGSNLSLIMIDPQDKDGRYLVETRLEALIKDLHIDKSKVDNITHKTARWNTIMFVLTTAMCSLAMLPYVFLNVKASSNFPRHIRWTFPALRATGGLLTTTMTQFVIQRRIGTLSRRWISQNCMLSGKAPHVGAAMRAGTLPLMWLYLTLLLLGVLASVVGYVGCFSVVQSASGLTGPLTWLGLEASLSLLRMFLWSLNPDCDDAPPFELVLTRDTHPPLPTCNMYYDIITEEGVLPLTRASQFLNSIASYAGIINHFDHPDVTLYYTFTRKGVRHDAYDLALDKPDERILYITIFDHKERANTRVYTREGDDDIFYATESSLPVIDPILGLLEIKLAGRTNNHDDPIIGSDDIREKVKTHYRSIMSQLDIAISDTCHDNQNRIRNKWTMTIADIPVAPQNENVLGTNKDTATSSVRDFQYLQQGRLERMRQSLSSARGEWLSTYVQWAIQALLTRSALQPEDGMADELPPNQAINFAEVARQLIDCIQSMEILLVKEMTTWEALLRGALDNMIGRDDVLEKDSERLRKEWKVNCGRRLGADIRAMETRMDRAQTVAIVSNNHELSQMWQTTHEEIQIAWQSLVEQFFDSPTPPAPPTDPTHSQTDLDWRERAQNIEQKISWSILGALERERLRQQGGLTNRLTIVLQETVFWLEHGIQHRGQLAACRLTQSKWLRLGPSPTLSTDIYSRALGNVNHVIFTDFITSPGTDYTQIAALITNLPPSVTSIFIPNSQHLSLAQIQRQRRTPLLINSYRHPSTIESFLHDNQSLLENAQGSEGTYVFIDTNGHRPSTSPAEIALWDGSIIAISFVGPPTGQLLLRLTHHCPHLQATLLFKTYQGSPTFRSPIPSNPQTIGDITLYASPSEHLSFVPNMRNHLIIHVNYHSPLWSNSPGYHVHDIQLQDTAGINYISASVDNSIFVAT